MTPRRAHITRARGLVSRQFFFFPRDNAVSLPCPRIAEPPPPTQFTRISGELESFPRPDLPLAFSPPSPSRADLNLVWRLASRVGSLCSVLKVLDFLCQWIRLWFSTPIFSVSSVQHLVESIRVLRQISIVSIHLERVSSLDRKLFAPVPYLFLRSIGLSHL